MWLSILRGTIRGDSQKILHRVRSPILFVRIVIIMYNHNEAEIWLSESMGPAPGRSSSVRANQR
jgi:hypothetical protein